MYELQLFYQRDRIKILLRVGTGSTYKEIKKDLFSQLYLNLNSVQNQKLKTLQTKLKKVEKMNRESAINTKISIKFESLKPYAVLYMQDIVAYFETII